MRILSIFSGSYGASPAGELSSGSGQMVRSRRLELPRVAPQRPQRCASTSSATTAAVAPGVEGYPLPDPGRGNSKSPERDQAGKLPDGRHWHSEKNPLPSSGMADFRQY